MEKAVENGEEAPQIIQLCTAALEKNCRNDEIGMCESYRNNRGDREKMETKILRQKFDLESNPKNINLSEYSTLTIAFIIKSYLRELPDPVLPVSFYEQFVTAASKYFLFFQVFKIIVMESKNICTVIYSNLFLITEMSDESERMEEMAGIFDMLPPKHKSTLTHIMRHIVEICIEIDKKNKTLGCERITQVFCHVLLRPSWEKILSLVKNMNYHGEIIYALLRLGEWAKYLPARFRRHRPDKYVPLTSSILELSTPSPLSDESWYWGNITRDEATRMLDSYSDGAFLVRDAANRVGDYTLTVKCDDNVRLIRIVQENGKFGFSPPYEFNSVKQLIEYYKTTSMARHNFKLDVLLKYPVEKDQNLQGEKKDILVKLLNHHNEFLELNDRIDQIQGEIHEIENDIDRKQQAISAFDQSISMFQNQYTSLRNSYESQPKNMSENDERNYCESFEKLSERIQSYELMRDKLKAEAEDSYKAKTNRERRLADLISAMNAVACKRHTVELHLKKHLGFSRSEIDSIIFQFREYKMRYPERSLNKAIEETVRKFERNLAMKEPNTIYGGCEDNAEWEKKDWYAGKIPRAKAEEILKDKKPGTFLIRDRDTNHALSVVYCTENGEKRCGHCIIEKYSDGIGFAYPFNFDDLSGLVEYYRHHTLKNNNRSLDVKLEYPGYSGP